MKTYSQYKKDSGSAIFEEGILPSKLTFCFNSVGAFVFASVLTISIFGLTRISEFLYFQF